jgi:hypothetical protein
MSTRGQNPSVLVGAFCKERRICVSCYRPWTERDTTRCVKCNQAHGYQKSLLRRNYERDPKAGAVCGGTRNPRPLLISALRSAKIAMLARNDPTNEGVRMCLRRRFDEWVSMCPSAFVPATSVIRSTVSFNSTPKRTTGRASVG